MRVRCWIACVAASALLAGPARADAVSDFYRGKTVTLLIGYEPGGGYDLYGRAVARFIGKHIPGNPAVIAQNMPGAASMTAANHLARVAPRDGTVFGAVNSALLLDTLIAGDASRAQFKASDMTMVGSVSSNAAFIIATKESGVASIADVRTKGLIIGTTALSSDSWLSAMAVKRSAKLDALKIIAGYPGTREISLAMDRGEVGARIWDMESLKAQKPEWMAPGAVHFLTQLAPKQMPEAPAGVKLAREEAADELDRQALDIIFSNALAFRPYLAPPGVPAEFAAALRAAFMNTMADPEFRAHMERIRLGVTPMSGAELQTLIAGIYEANAAVVARVRQLTAP